MSLSGKDSTVYGESLRPITANESAMRPVVLKGRRVVPEVVEQPKAKTSGGDFPVRSPMRPWDVPQTTT